MKIKQKKNSLNSLADLHASLVASLTPEEVAKREEEQAAAAKEAALEAYLEKRRERDAAKAALADEIAKLVRPGQMKLKRRLRMRKRTSQQWNGDDR